MSGALSSLFSGSITPPQPTGSDTSTGGPVWLQDYLYNVDQAASNLAAQPYTPFPGPSVATPSSATTQAWQQASANQGDWQPQLTQAQNTTNGALNLSAQGANLIQSASPYIQQGAGLTNQAVGMTEAASQPIGASQINQYMSPYTSDVVGALQQAANTNLQQNQLPLISSQFVGAGQAASPQMAQADNNALYQSNQALDQATAGALQSGYQGALNTALTEQGAQMQGASQIGAYGGQLGQYGGELGQLGGALNSAAAEQGSLGAQTGQLGALTQQLGASDTGLLAASGAAQDTNSQSNINAALNNFYAQQQWPYQNLSYASNILNGQPITSNTQQVGLTYPPPASYTTSPISAFLGGTLATSAISNGLGLGGSNNLSALGLARGGRVRRGALSYAKAA